MVVGDVEMAEVNIVVVIAVANERGLYTTQLVMNFHKEMEKRMHPYLPVVMEVVPRNCDPVRTISDIKLAVLGPN